MRSHTEKLTLVLLTGCLLFATRAVAEDKKETDAEKEAKQAAEEDKADQSSESAAINSMKKISGKLRMGPPEGDDNPNPDVVAMLTADTGEIYQVKLNTPTLLPKLQIFDKKKVSVTGKLRNENKYLIVFSVADPPVSVPAERIYRGKF